MFYKLFGGLSTSVGIDFVGGQVGFSQGGLEFLYFVADPEQPLDGTLRATMVRIASAKKDGEFNVHRPLVFFLTWGSGKFHTVCKILSFEREGTKMPSAEDVSQLFEKLKLSPGVDLLNDGSSTICVGQSNA